MYAIRSYYVATSAGRGITRQEQAAIEHEMSNTRTRLTRRNALPNYLTGLLVGMGLLGTFIGLLATLNDISILISSVITSYSIHYTKLYDSVQTDWM